VSGAGSVTHWIRQLKAGDQVAFQKLWEGYFRRLVGLARHRLRGAPRAADDEEDVALSAFDSFCRRAQEGRFPRLHDRHDLWQLLVVIAGRKASNLAQHECRQKRGGGKVHARPDDDEDPLTQVLSSGPSPAFAAQVAEECRRLLDRLGDPELRSIALGKMEGYTTEEVAAKLGCVPRTVRRKWQVIPGRWNQEMSP
jgi:DNA-directed RNA polymerase specialized sigma24 family protein